MDFNMTSRFILAICLVLAPNASARDVKKCTKAQLNAIEGWLFDLDGCLYTPAGLINGTQTLFNWLDQTKKPYVLLSNSFRSKGGVTQKFNDNPKYKVTQVITEDQVYTAALALATYMEATAPPGSKIFVVNTDIKYSDGKQENVVTIMKDNVKKAKYDSWDIRTALSDAEVAAWSHPNVVNKFVVQGFMGNPSNTLIGDPKSSGQQDQYSTMDRTLMSKIHRLLDSGSGARYVVGAPDAVDAQPKDAKYKDIDTSWPTMGGYEQFFLKSAEIFPGTDAYNNYANTGKGGNKGVEYMINVGVAMLQKKNAKLTKDKIAMVGDNLGTDIKAGNEAGVKSIFVLTGAHDLDDAGKAHNPEPTCYLRDVGETAEIAPVKGSSPDSAITVSATFALFAAALSALLMH